MKFGVEFPVLVVANPGDLADTVVEPGAMGSKETPPKATDDGESKVFIGIVIVTGLVVVSDAVVNAPTPGSLLIKVTAMGPSALTRWIVDRLPSALRM